MPQLDKVTFLSQFFWLCLFFWGFYLVALKFFLPFMSRILKYRKKRLHGGGELLNASTESVDSHSIESTEIMKVRGSGEKLLLYGYKNSKEAFKQNLQKTEKWLFDNVAYVNKEKVKDINSIYLQLLAEDLISHKLLMQKSFLDFSATIYISTLKDKIKSATRSNAYKED